MKKLPKNPNASYGGQSYVFNVLLYNASGDTFLFNPSNVKSLLIRDNLSQIFTTGELVFHNSYDIIFRSIYDKDKKIHSGYRFSGDGTDHLRIEIYPISQNNNAFPDEVWTMCYDFTIYDVEDIPVSNQSEKMKKFLFWDKTYANMFSNISSWSTLDLVENPSTELHNLPDEEKRIPTGKILKHILKLAGESRFNGEWNNGSTKLFYSSYNSITLIENFNYILTKHLSETNDICILRKTRDEGIWTFVPFTKYFELSVDKNDITKPGIMQIEHIFLDGIESNEPVITSYKSPLDKNSSTINDIKTLHPMLGSYNYIDISPRDHTNLMIDYPTHNYNFSDGKFTILRKETTIDSIVNYTNDTYIKYMKTYNNKPYNNISVGEGDVLNIQNTISFGNSYSDILAESRNIQIKNALYLNNMLSFSIQGSSHRQAGRILAVDRLNSSTILDNDIDNKILGQWMITKVYHRWEDGKYINDVVCNRYHNYFNK